MMKVIAWRQCLNFNIKNYKEFAIVAFSTIQWEKPKADTHIFRRFDQKQIAICNWMQEVHNNSYYNLIPRVLSKKEGQFDGVFSYPPTHPRDVNPWQEKTRVNTWIFIPLPLIQHMWFWIYYIIFTVQNS